ncbi:hypothetical protein K450DRAFT_235023 [Umbelopsis ramanniana AG]|uniref:Uncharacterized protein n=1 Tax=Umbelopsis ramanniana AG TaxID=1314678 RepID=A0AAD5EBJ2_UMBRA|nr:uncharacterized protein K450DRAFT_235023 [Umbelopsis ramanniana AG]KAI8580881.1 hypothetical protein K450DRAFT_235023 [Umbelopsis ramanniana AG]
MTYKAPCLQSKLWFVGFQMPMALQSSCMIVSCSVQSVIYLPRWSHGDAILVAKWR